jgi:hypothetical protein
MLTLMEIATLGFRPMDADEHRLFRGAELNTLIAYDEHECVWLLCANVLTRIRCETEGDEFKFEQTDFVFDGNYTQNSII